MGHKVHPLAHRLPVVYTWDSRWLAKDKKQATDYLRQDIAMRAYFDKKFKDAGIDAVSIERNSRDVTITILAAKPGVIIGRSGQGLDEARRFVEKQILQFKSKVKLNVQALKNPALSAAVMAQAMVSEIERRIPFRRVMKQAMEKVMSAGALGVKVAMAGRLNGVEIARREKLSAGKMSLITLRSLVDYAFAEAHTIYGKIGVKVWIYRGETFALHDKFEKK